MNIQLVFNSYCLYSNYYKFLIVPFSKTQFHHANLLIPNFIKAPCDNVQPSNECNSSPKNIQLQHNFRTFLIKTKDMKCSNLLPDQSTILTSDSVGAVPSLPIPSLPIPAAATSAAAAPSRHNALNDGIFDPLDFDVIWRKPSTIILSVGN